MRRFTSLRLLLALVSASLFLLASMAIGQPKTKNPQTSAEQPADIPGARLHLPETSFDFGYIPNDSRVTHVYKLMSVGEQPLKILRVKPG